MKDIFKKFLRIQFIKFCIVGGLGFVTDMAVFTILKNLLQAESKLLLNIIPLFGYIAAVTQNYLINHFWTFGDQTKKISPSKKAYAIFFAVSLTALMPRYIVYNYILSSFGKSGLYPEFANFVGIVAATVFNFIGSKYFVFVKKEK